MLVKSFAELLHDFVELRWVGCFHGLRAQLANSIFQPTRVHLRALTMRMVLSIPQAFEVANRSPCRLRVEHAWGVTKEQTQR